MIHLWDKSLLVPIFYVQKAGDPYIRLLEAIKMDSRLRGNDSLIGTRFFICHPREGPSSSTSSSSAKAGDPYTRLHETIKDGFPPARE